MFLHGLVILLATFAVALPSHGNWDIRFFPTPNKPARVKEGTNFIFRQDVVISQVVFAVQERYQAAGRSLPLESNFFYKVHRKQEQILESAKLSTLNILDDYINHEHPEWTGPSSVNITNIKYWTASNILQSCSLPTNYFEFTPVRNLMEDNQWYQGEPPDYWKKSIDYGWDGLYKIVKKLKYTGPVGGTIRNESNFVYAVTLFSDNENCMKDGNCEINSTNIGPKSISELTFLDVGNLNIIEEYFKIEFAPESTDDFSAFSQYSYLQNKGFPYVPIGSTNSSIYTFGTHLAYKYTKTDAGVLEKSLTTNNFPSATNCVPNASSTELFNTWVFDSIYSGKGVTADTNAVLYGAQMAALEVECDVCDFIYEGFDNVGDSIEVPCLGERGLNNLNTGRNLWAERGLKSTKDVTHIVQWDFIFD